MPEEIELIDIDKLKERLNKGIPYFLGVRPSRFGRVEVDNFFVFLDLVEKYMNGKTSIKISKAIAYFRKTESAKFNVATWFYVLHFIRIFQKYINGEDITYLPPVQLDTFELAKEIFNSPAEQVTVS